MARCECCGKYYDRGTDTRPNVCDWCFANHRCTVTVVPKTKAMISEEICGLERTIEKLNEEIGQKMVQINNVQSVLDGLKKQYESMGGNGQ